MDPARYFERWFQSCCESERLRSLQRRHPFERTKREDEDDLAND
ncbi:hypothetical protein IQ26_00287 [Mesorhizobium tianshanense]|uniref:Uncharacterized protein n=1 Tax=Mesorhizobium tianshanense TaxID=39844 RepID=A0A562PFU0_9HYPH|nr:hypothetical protein IQ26_00287 [Mesorhizobium tianshanense]